MLLKDKLYQLHKNRQGILAANFYNLETLKAILKASAVADEPVILQASAGTIRLFGLELLVELVRAAVKYYNVQAWLHLDHGPNIEIVKACIDAGFDSVMIDASEQEFDKNVEITRSVVEYAQRFNINVEAELGYVPKLGQQADHIEYTTVEQAREFVRLTGVNALAIAVGTAHGFYKAEPKLCFSCIEQIREHVDVPLVLHGCSGLSDEQLRKAIKSGITKINLATEIKSTFSQQLRESICQSQEIDPRNYLPAATDAVYKLIKKKFEIFKINNYE